MNFFDVAALCVRSDSIYKDLPGVDCFDAQRDCLTFSGGMPVIAHPPCRGWGRLRHFAHVRPGELDVARFCVDQVRRFGGVLEHPSCPTLWPDQSIPSPGCGKDSFGGWTYVVNQSFFGHRAPKLTWLYIVGVEPSSLPAVPFHLGLAAGRVELMSVAERERTTAAFALWLLDLARACRD